eukprot:Blabericola_migrator_1__8336@NODE_4330_length_1217_cov_869_009565_g2677_i0_p3_GENE_NODE_4330_length_1217_cov_869_009565_g2677_i0NODE_4330_length_1217_cov_869_009565_g2677_i0_p3_ORF_typecomplete_len135_score17_24Integrin_beta/PF00362_18/4_1e13VWA/PF00092_28/0_00015VWA_2/PF13519_6/0_00044_NODE_4330_length_1217_cov_869_009565_g2677_i0229633
MPIDVLFLHDTTGSFDDDLPNVCAAIPTMVQQILAQNSDSHFGVSEFKDKPYYPLEEEDDFCYKTVGPLTADAQTFKDAYATLYASSRSAVHHQRSNRCVSGLETCVSFSPGHRGWGQTHHYEYRCRAASCWRH